jgi:hypothetical protein
MKFRAQDIQKLHLEIVGTSTAVALLTPGLSAASILAGGAVMGADFWLMGQIARRVFEPGRKPGWIAALMIAKFALLLGPLAILFWRAPIEPLSFGAGATLLLVACVVAALRGRPAAQ